MRRVIAGLVLVAALLFALDAVGVHLHRGEIAGDHRLFAIAAAVLFAVAGVWGLRRR